MIKDDFCEYIQKFGKINPPSSEYQILNIDINNSSILIYQSGIVILEKNPKIKEIINIFLFSTRLFFLSNKYQIKNYLFLIINKLDLYS